MIYDNNVLLRLNETIDKLGKEYEEGLRNRVNYLVCEDKDYIEFIKIAKANPAFYIGAIFMNYKGYYIIPESSIFIQIEK